MLSLIVAHDSEFGIGKKNSIPWRLRKDLAYFKNITIGKTYDSKKINAVIMGRKTWDSLPNSVKPLPERINIVLTKKEDYFKKLYQDTFFSDSIDQALDYIKDYATKILMKEVGEIFIIGGGSVYTEVLQRYDIDKMYITEIYQDFNCDVKFCQKVDFKEKIKSFDLISCSNFEYEKEIYFRYFTYQNKKHNPQNKILYKNLEEQQYLDLLYKIALEGIKKQDRTGTGTISVFGETQKFNLRNTFPLLTTKRMFLRGIFEELMLYLRGKTDNKILNEKGIHIWDGNTSRSFLDKRQLFNYPEGDMGETYGFNFRHFGGEYKGCHHEYKKGTDGFDQLANAIHLIKHNPESRRIIINLWNPYTCDKAALPSCLCWYQFYVNPYQKELSLLINIRSSDFFLANNWNVCTGALLVHLICNLEDIDLTPGDLTVISGDTHLYLTHLDQVKINLERHARPFPKLIIKENKKCIEEFTFEDLNLIGYNPYPGIKAPMAV